MYASRCAILVHILDQVGNAIMDNLGRSTQLSIINELRYAEVGS